MVVNDLKFVGIGKVIVLGIVLCLFNLEYGKVVLGWGIIVLMFVFIGLFVVFIVIFFEIYNKLLFFDNVGVNWFLSIGF